MFDATVFSVMIGSLSGTMEEVIIAKEVIRKWNQENAKRFGRIFLPVEWSMTPEDIKKVDIVISIVDNWIENSAFIEKYVKTGKKVLLFFNAFQDPNNTIQSEYDALMAFKARLDNRCLCSDYMGVTDFCRLLNKRLMAE